MSYLYAVKMLIPDYRFQPIKIGFSINPERRIREFTRGPFPITWMGQWSAPMGRMNEAEAHARFAAYRLSGEWFYPGKDLIDFVEQSISEQGSALVSEKKIAKYEQRYASLFPLAPPPPRQRLPDPFDVSDLTLPLQLEAIDRVKAMWPRVAMGAQFLKRCDVALLTGLTEDTIEALIDLRFQIGTTVRSGLNGMMDFLDRYPQYAEGIAANMEARRQVAA